MTGEETKPVDLEAIGRRANAAAPGPWLSDGAILIGPDRRSVARYFTEPGFLQTMDFIAHAREDVPALIAEVRRLREALAGLVAINAEDFPRGPDGRINWNAYPTTFGYANAYRAALVALGEEVLP